MSYKQLNPEMLAFLDNERQFTELRSGGKVRRVKIEKVNQAWLVRFLPVVLGASNLFFVRHGQHWYHKIPIVCPRCVSSDFGGDENADCPVCDLADQLNAEEHEEVSNFGYRLRANQTWLTYCLVFEIDPGRGDRILLPPSDYMRPWEFVLYKAAFDQLSNYYRRGLTASRQLSILDPKRGNDFWATKTNSGIRLDSQESGPMFEPGPNFNKQVEEVLSAVKEPKITVPTLRQLEVYARKAEAAAYGESEPEPKGRGRSNRRNESEADDGAQDDSEVPVERVGRRFSQPTQGRRIRNVEEPDPQPVDQDTPEEPTEAPVEQQVEDDAPVDAIAAEQDDQVPGTEVEAPTPARTATRPAAPTTRPAAATRPVAATRPAAATTSVARPAPRPAPAATTATRPAAATKPATPTTRPAPVANAPQPKRAAAPVVRESVNEEEDPNVAEEANDPTGVAETPLPEEGQAEEGQVEEGQVEDAQEDVPPPPVTPRASVRPGAAAAGAQSSLRMKLAQKVNAANNAR